MIDGGVFGVSVCGRLSHWPTWNPGHECSYQIGCASSPAVLQRTRSLQLGSVGSCEPREKPCDLSQHGKSDTNWSHTALKSRTLSSQHRPWIWLRLYLGWVWLCVQAQKLRVKLSPLTLLCGGMCLLLFKTRVFSTARIDHFLGCFLNYYYYN